jgi:uncharacterized membrane protein
MHPSTRLACLLSTLLLPLPALADAPWFEGVGIRAGDTASSIGGISDDGTVAAGYARDATNGTRPPLRWDSTTGLLGLPIPAGAFGYANSLSPDGSTIVGDLVKLSGAMTTGQAGFVWRQASGTIPLTNLDDPNVRSVCTGASTGGAVLVGGLGNATAVHATYWDGAGVPHPVDGLPAGEIRSIAWGVSRDGTQIVGSVETAAGTEAFHWESGGGATTLGDLPGGALDSEAIATSDDGSVIVGVGADADGARAVRWVGGGAPQDLGVVPTGTGAVAVDVSADGQAIVGRAFTPGPGPLQWAFLWTEADGMRKLNDVLTELGIDLDDWILTNAASISADGRTIAGTGVNPDFGLEGWVAYLPEPRGGALAGAALATLAALRARRARPR